MHLCEMAVLPFEINQQCRQRLTNKLLHLKILQLMTHIHIFSSVFICDHITSRFKVYSPLMTILIFKRKEIKPSVCTNTKATW